MNLFVIIAIVLAFWLVLCEAVTFLVYGRLLKEHRLDSYFTPERLDELQLNEFNTDNNLFYVPSGRFIARTIFSLTSKWYIHEVGMVPRWSKWTRRLDEKRSILIDKKIKGYE